MGEKNTPGCAKRFEPAPWCTGTRRAGSKMGGREDGLGGYLWSFSAPKVRYFLYRPSRGSQVVEEVVEEVLGEEFDGVVVSDFYGAYNVHHGLHQRCWTHLLRDIHHLKEQHPKNPDLTKWAQGVREVYDQAQAYPGPAPELPATVQRCNGATVQRCNGAAVQRCSGPSE